MQAEARPRRVDTVEARPVAELLACPPETGTLLTASSQSLSFDAGETIFHQSAKCNGLYLILSGSLMRKTDRLETRIVLGAARPGDLVELAAALGDHHHTYSLVAQTPGTLLLLPIEALQQAFHSYPPLRMRLLEELAREVSRAYRACSFTNALRTRRRPEGTAPG